MKEYFVVSKKKKKKKEEEEEEEEEEEAVHNSTGTHIYDLHVRHCSAIFNRLLRKPKIRPRFRSHDPP